MFSLSVPRAGTGARCGQQLHIWDFKKKKLDYTFFDVYLNILHLSYKTYAENTMFIFELSLHHLSSLLIMASASSCSSLSFNARSGFSLLWRHLSSPVLDLGWSSLSSSSSQMIFAFNRRSSFFLLW